MMKSMEFRDQNIRDILLVLGELNDVSIVPDETVTGKASYVFANMDFKQALQAFLDTFRLSYSLKNGIYYISKVAVTVNDDGTVNVSASDLPAKDIIRVLSSQMGMTILSDNLPNDPLTINVRNSRIEDVLKIIIARSPDFILDTQSNYFYLRNKASPGGKGLSLSSEGAIRRTNDRYDLQINQSRFKDLLLSLFSTAKKEFILLIDRDMTIENISLKNLDFEGALKVLLLENNADFKVDNGIYYIYEVQRKDLLKKYLTNIIIPFQYISSADFQKLIPPNLNAGNFFRLDDKGNKLVLSGSFEEIKPIWDFVNMIDKPSDGNSLVRVDLKYVKTDDVLPLMPPDLAGFNPQALPSKTALIVSLPQAKKKSFLDFIDLIDQPVIDEPIRLRYMKADDLLAKLPPSVTDANVVKTNDSTLIFFKGPPQLLKRFKKDLEELDRPKPLLRYELLVLQFVEGKGISLAPSATIQAAKTDNTFTGTLGQALNLNFDVIGLFGATFGASLNAAITDSDARVVADTTLNGLSGEKITFQNTTTTYYVANEISTSGTATVVGSVNSLSSGLIMNLQGWISSDGMVTLQVDATLSKEAASSSSTTSSSTSSTTTLPPDTTEKKLSTQVRMLSGQPLVIGGLKEDDKSTSYSRTPILGYIPLLGYLFRNETSTISHTEFTIYIVPILDKPDEQLMSPDERMLMYYHKLNKGRA
jgi:type II secretory pathway component GspD/PulD (secretin)